MLKHLVFTLAFFTTVPIFGQQITIVDKYDDLEKLMASNDTTYIVNFWATWCGPCVKELPHFYELAQKMKGTKNKVVLVSLDFKSQVEKKLVPFFEKNPTIATVYLLADKDYNDYISKVHAEWEGSIPVTVVIKKDKKLFTNQEFESMDEIMKFVQPLITL
jgi:thiol-disulfide isomerase/thioredoxin